MEVTAESSETGKRESKSPRSLRRAAMDCLARREHSFFELKQKLQLKFPEKSPDEVHQELVRLREENLQSDKRFVESFVRYRKSRGYGYIAIRENLRGRYVAEDLINSCLFDDDEEWKDILCALVERRMPRDGRLRFGSKEHQRLVRFLQNRGFPSTLVQNSLKGYLAH